jgi:ketosteroid isomerase-like protein
MSKTFWAVFMGAGFALVSSSALYANNGAVDLEAAKRAIRIADLELAKAVADRSVESFRALVDDDAVFFGKEMSRGREAVMRAWLPLFTDRSLFLKWNPLQIEVASSGDLGYSIGEYERIGKDSSGNPSTATGSYVSIWRKHPDGKWRIVLDIGSPGTALPRK